MFNDTSKTILLVEDNPDDVALTLRAFKKNNIMNKFVVAKDGVEALDYLNGTGEYEGRDVNDIPQIVLLDLKLPKVNGMEVLKAIRAEENQIVAGGHIDVFKEQQDLIDGYSLGANSYIRKPVDFEQFTEAVRQLGLYWLVLNINPAQDA